MASRLECNAGSSEERIDAINSAQLTCHLCSKLYREPRILPCLHSFCGQCLHKEIERSGTKQNMECPTCQKSIPIPKGGVNAIPQNLHLGFEVEVAGYMSKIGSDGDKSCDACIDGSTGPAVVFCCTCRNFLCELCHHHHKQSKMFHHHQLVGFDKNSIKLLPSIMKPIEHLCPHHEKEKMNVFCDTCQLLTCRDCILVFHKDHRINDMHNVAKVHRDAMKEALVSAQDIILKLTRAIDGNNKMAEQVEDLRQNATLIITKAFEQLHQTIEERKKTLLSEMEDISLSKTTALTLQKEQLMKLQDETGHYTKMTSHILQTHTDHELVAIGNLLLTELQVTLKKADNVSLTPNQSTDIHVSFPYIDCLIMDISRFGHVMDSSPSPSQSTWSSELVAKVKDIYCVNVETMTSKGEKYPYGGLQVMAELRPKCHDGTVVPGEVEDFGDGTYIITFIPLIAGPHQLLITLEGQHAQNSPADLDVRRTCSSQFKHVIKCSDGPSGIAIHDSGDIYVSCLNNGSIHVFDPAGQQKRTIGKCGRCDGQFKHPFGLFIKGDVMYVADSGNHRIQKLTTEGQFLQKFGQRGTGQGEFQYPVSVIIDKSNKLIVSDVGNHRVVVMDQAGTWLLTINGNVAGNLPYGLTLDPQGNIHVIAKDSNTIKVFSPKGTFIRSYGDVQCPLGIMIDEEGYGLVNEGKGNCLSIFDPQGNKIQAIGNLSCPHGVSLHSKSGSLYVANYGADTLLKYSLSVM